MAETQYRKWPICGNFAIEYPPLYWIISSIISKAGLDSDFEIYLLSEQSANNQIGYLYIENNKCFRTRNQLGFLYFRNYNTSATAEFGSFHNGSSTTEQQFYDKHNCMSRHTGWFWHLICYKRVHQIYRMNMKIRIECASLLPASLSLS